MVEGPAPLWLLDVFCYWEFSFDECEEMHGCDQLTSALFVVGAE